MFSCVLLFSCVLPRGYILLCGYVLLFSYILPSGYHLARGILQISVMLMPPIIPRDLIYTPLLVERRHVGGHPPPSSCLAIR